jgi:hypothetical protein
LSAFLGISVASYPCAEVVGHSLTHSAVSIRAAAGRSIVNEGAVAVSPVRVWRYAVKRLSQLFTVIGLVIGALLATACDENITAPAAELTQVKTGVNLIPLSFTRCTPQPADSSSARIGPSGGTLRAGRHMLRIPAGALRRSVLISMTVPSDTLNFVVFGPEGLTFDPDNQPTLTMSYRNCSVNKPGQAGLEIVYTNDALTAVLDSTETIAADTLNNTVGGRLKHFSKYVLTSRYAVAY